MDLYPSLSGEEDSVPLSRLAGGVTVVSEPIGPVRATTVVRRTQSLRPCEDVSMDAPAERRTDAELVTADFAVLFDRHAAAIRRYFARRAGPAAADDLLSQTFLTAYERRDSYDRSRPDARPWLYGIATNQLYRRSRDEVRQLRAWARTGVDPVAVDHATRVADRVDARSGAVSIAGALADLPTADREALLLVAWGQLSYAEVAEALRLPVGTVRSKLHRARAALRAAFDRDRTDRDAPNRGRTDRHRTDRDGEDRDRQNGT